MSPEYHRIQKFSFEFNALALGACLLIGTIGCAGGGGSLPEGSGGTTDPTPGMGGGTTSNPGMGGSTTSNPGTGGARAGSGGAPGTGGTPGGCAGTLSKCGNVCVDLTGSQNNCGACGKVCRADQSCFLSACKCPTGAM